jgi:branched-chain amino acid transport system ATP-binding protein
VSPALALEDVEVRRGGMRVLRGVSLAIEEGELVALLGPNGAGKTTLLDAVSGLVGARGTIRVGERSVIGRSPHAIARLGVAHVPERRGTFAGLTVQENLLAAGHMLSARRRRVLLQEVLDRFEALGPLRGRAAETLSGGEQQMLALGRGLMMDPRIMLLDEPSLGLAPRLREVILELVRALNAERGLTLLLVEQNAALALDLAHRAYVLRGGEVVATGTAAELRASGALPAAYLDAPA